MRSNGPLYRKTAKEMACQWIGTSGFRDPRDLFDRAIGLGIAALERAARVRRNDATLSSIETANVRKFAAAIPTGMRALVREELDRLDAEGGAA